MKNLSHNSRSSRCDMKPALLEYKVQVKRSSGIQRSAVRWMSTDVSEEHIASIFRIEKISSARNQRASRWKATCLLTTAVKTSNPK
jgi:hypothetical protein